MLYFKKLSSFFSIKDVYRSKLGTQKILRFSWVLGFTLLLLSFNFTALASNTTIDPSATDASYPVLMDGKELFRVNVRVGAFTQQERARVINERLLRIAQDYTLDINTIRITNGEEESDILLTNRIIMTVTAEDARAEQETLELYTEERAETFKAALLQYREERQTKNIAFNVIYALLLTIGLYLSFFLLNSLLAMAHLKSTVCEGDSCQYSLKIQKFELLSQGQVLKIIDNVIGISGYIGKVFIIYFYLYILLSIFPGSRQYGNQLLGYVLTPVTTGFDAFVDYLPNLFIIIFILFLSRYTLKLIQLFFNELKKGTIQISGFYTEWCDPTYKIVRFLILALTLISIFPYIPGSHSPIFQGISVLLGVLFSLGSSSAIANIIAGISLTYTRAFIVGDRVKIGDSIGDVLEKSLLVTQIRTIKNVDISIPNSLILNSPIINYSRSATEANLILHTTITIGYDVPWRTVHDLLISAALATPNILADPPPFVLQTSLDDFYVSYQINASTDKPHRMAVTYSNIHKNIQDQFNTANVEILSPHYKALRDGNQVTIPQENLSDDYTAPVFKVETLITKPKSER